MGRKPVLEFLFESKSTNIVFGKLNFFFEMLLSNLRRCRVCVFSFNSLKRLVYKLARLSFLPHILMRTVVHSLCYILGCGWGVTYSPGPTNRSCAYAVVFGTL